MTSENSDSGNQQRNLASVFSMQGAGTLLCALVLVSVTYLLDDTETQWRVALAAGAAPMMLAFYFRWRMHETAAWERAHKVSSM